MKLILSFLLVFSVNAWSQSIDVEGKFFGVNAEGFNIEKSAVLSLPAKGEGKVTLDKDGLKVIAEKFFTISRNGQKIFYIVFPKTDSQDKYVMRGTYLRGNSAALYYGDVYVVSKSIDLSLVEESKEHPSVVHKGGFWFEAKILR